MPDSRTHRGAHPEDARLFGPGAQCSLNSAVGDFSWLLTRGYAPPSALKVVGDRYRLDARQRTAVTRCACADDARASRAAREAPAGAVRGAEVLVDGYNVLTTVEAALGGGVVLRARDGCYRDMAGVHGTYRKVEETLPALERAGTTLAALGASRAVWYLDSPVSNSGRLKGMLAEAAKGHGWDWSVEVVPDPDAVLSRAGPDPGPGAGGPPRLVATADSVILDRCGPWFALAREVVTSRVPAAWVVDMRGWSEPR